MFENFQVNLYIFFKLDNFTHKKIWIFACSDKRNIKPLFPLCIDGSGSPSVVTISAASAASRNLVEMPTHRPSQTYWVRNSGGRSTNLDFNPFQVILKHTRCKNLCPRQQAARIP